MKWSIALLIATAAPFAPAMDWQPVDDIRTAAEDFARNLVPGARTRIEATGLDARLRLPRCGTALEAFATGSRRAGRALTVGVRCPATGGWSLYVPVRMSVSRQVMVAARPLRRGQTLGAGDLRVEEREVTSLPGGYYQSAEQLGAQVLTRDLAAGAVIAPSALRQPTLIRRGQSVHLLSRLGGIEIRARGEALSDGAPEQRIQVRNSSSGRVVEGIVRSADIVEVAG